jgi:diacylglycerol kinase family enzyme
MNEYQYFTSRFGSFVCVRLPVLFHRYDTLVAGGGDGTLNELVAALLKHDAPSHISIAQLPLGTANDLASAAGISLVSCSSS